jgi:hypothetical protein
MQRFRSAGVGMEEFLLKVDGRIIRILIEDARGPAGSVPTLICHEARLGEIWPSGSTVPPGQPPGKWFPPMSYDRLTLEQAEEDLRYGEIQLDVSELPPGVVPFALGQFAEKAAEAVDAGATEVRLDREKAERWGSQLPGTEPLVG